MCLKPVFACKRLTIGATRAINARTGCTCYTNILVPALGPSSLEVLKMVVFRYAGFGHLACYGELETRRSGVVGGEINRSLVVADCTGGEQDLDSSLLTCCYRGRQTFHFKPLCGLLERHVERLGADVANHIVLAYA